MEPAAKVRSKSDERILSQMLQKNGLRKCGSSPLTGHISYDEFAIDIAHLNAVEEETIAEEKEMRRSMLLRRQPLAGCMFCEKRRESLVSHE